MSDIRRRLSAGAMSHCPSVDSVGYCNNTAAASDIRYSLQARLVLLSHLTDVVSLLFCYIGLLRSHQLKAQNSFVQLYHNTRIQVTDYLLSDFR